MGVLDGKVGVVLGASSGIGWRIAERFVEEGAELIVAARRVDQLEKLSKEIGATPFAVMSAIMMILKHSQMLQ